MTLLPVVLGLFMLALLNYVKGNISFTSPRSTELYPIDGTVRVTLSGLGAAETALVTQNCGSAVQVSETFSVASASQNYILPSGYTGSCTYTATITGSSSPVTSVRILVGNPVKIDAPTPSTRVTAGTQFDIELSYSPATTPNLVFDVQLDCRIPGVAPAVQKVIGNDQSQKYLVPDNFYAPTCILSVLPTVSGYYGVTSVPIEVIEKLFIATPQAGSNQQIGVPVTILVASSNPSSNIPITLILNSIPVSAQVNIDQLVTFDASFLGTVMLSVSVTSPYTSPPSITFNLKYGLEFTQAPDLIVRNAPFQVYLKTSADPVAPADQSVLLSLTCGASLTDQWAVPLNELVILSAIGTDSQTQLNCFFSTPSNSIYYYQASKNVIMLKPPNGGVVYPITAQEQAEFAKSIAFPLRIF